MKNIKIQSVIFCASVIFMGLATACYTPVANTSEHSERESVPTGTPPDSLADRNMNNSSTDTGSSKDTGTDSNGTEVITPVEGGFRANLEANLKRIGLSPSDVADENHPVEKRILLEYGAVFLTKAKPPAKAMFTNDSEVTTFQTGAGSKRMEMDGGTIELQPKAAQSLQAAVEEAMSSGLKITPRDGAEAGKRTYQKTLDLWNDRFYKACDHWKGKGRLTVDQVSRLKALPIKQQVAEVLELEKSGIYFNTFFNNSILFSVAAPGTSQHLAMVAFDAVEHQDQKVRNILARHGWFRTVQNDAPHFTYLGFQERELPGLGLKKVTKRDGEFWVPDI